MTITSTSSPDGAMVADDGRESEGSKAMTEVNLYLRGDGVS
jgi:hypothetical protein